MNHNLVLPLTPGSVEYRVINYTTHCESKLRCSPASPSNPCSSGQGGSSMSTAIVHITQEHMLVRAVR